MQPDLILAFDTSAAHCAAGLLCGDRFVDLVEEMAKGQAERLVPLIDELMASEGREWSEIAAIAVGVGPGNFTGIRISVALARGLALGLGVPAIGVTGFEAVPAPLSQPYWIVLPAPRGQVYAQRFLNAPEPAQICDASTVSAFGEPICHLSEVPVRTFLEQIARVGRSKVMTAQPRPAPYYLRSADASPSSDLPPVILP